MAATRDILATYRGPAAVVRRLLAPGPREDRALIYLMIACLIIFVAQTPRLAREAHLTGTELDMLLGATLMAWLFIAPLLLYVLAGVSHLVARLLGGRGSFYNARLALFWALLASSPLILLHGLTAGFVGPGIELSIVGLLWLCVFLWFWIGGLLVAERKAS
ncbi:YIP1 family protein [Sulfitobacter aestuarii]|uniref:YIP1 family protein n=1 Tax=Sulfitobacter aestuarii TaxID=2161676 RepID=A0ABW5U3C0_9RHOB